MFSDIPIPEANINKAPCTISYSKEHVASWAEKAKTCLADALYGMVSQYSKQVLMQEALECITLLNSVLAETSTFDGKTYTMLCNDDCKACYKDQPEQSEDLQKN